MAFGALLLLGFALGFAPAGPRDDGRFHVRDFGAVGDGTADDTAALQAALDAAGTAGGGTVFASRGSYRLAGVLNVPNNVTLAGEFVSVPSHNGIRDAGQPKPGEDGTTFLLIAGRGDESAPPAITLHTNSTLQGVVLWYPEQKPDAEPVPYPFAIAMRGKNPAVLDVEMLNPFNGIDATNNERHLIRNVSGQPLRRGIVVDAIYDVGRIENVHFNPWWSLQPAVFDWQEKHGEAFVFGRTDWQSVTNCFAFGYRVGFKFEKTQAGVCNGSFLGIGADRCHRAVLVEGSAPFGLLITNGQFTSFTGEDPVMVRVAKGNTGTVRFSNSSFWGPCKNVARIEGTGTVGFDGCTFVQWDRDKEGRPAIDVLGGTAILRGCAFQQPLASVRVAAKASAVISGNVFAGADAMDIADGANVAATGNLTMKR